MARGAAFPGTGRRRLRAPQLLQGAAQHTVSSDTPWQFLARRGRWAATVSGDGAGGPRRDTTGLYAVKPASSDLLDGPRMPCARRVTRTTDIRRTGLRCSSAARRSSPDSSQPWLWLVPAAGRGRLAFNALDGMVATRDGLARPWGKVLNELCDRLADLAFLFPLLLVPGDEPDRVSAALLSMLLVSYLGILSEAAGARRENGGCSARPIGCCASAPRPSSPPRAGPGPGRLLPAFLIAGSVVTLVQRGRRIHAAL